jgi:hypothetical protein
MACRISWAGGVSQGPVGLDHSSVVPRECRSFFAVATNLFSAWYSRFAALVSAYRVSGASIVESLRSGKEARHALHLDRCAR